MMLLWCFPRVVSITVVTMSNCVRYLQLLQRKQVACALLMASRALCMMSFGHNQGQVVIRAVSRLSWCLISMLLSHKRMFKKMIFSLFQLLAWILQIKINRAANHDGATLTRRTSRVSFKFLHSAVGNVSPITFLDTVIQGFEPSLKFNKNICCSQTEKD